MIFNQAIHLDGKRLKNPTSKRIFRKLVSFWGSSAVIDHRSIAILCTRCIFCQAMDKFFNPRIYLSFDESGHRVTRITSK
jgi:hypothetical protein